MHPLNAAVRDISKADRAFKRSPETWQVLRKLNETHQCARCGKCCTNQVVGMLGREAVAIARHLNMPASMFKAQYIERQAGKWLMMRRMDDGTCPFLEVEYETPSDIDEKRLAVGTRCAIYEVRPETCRRFPWLTPETLVRSQYPRIAVNDEMCAQMSRTFRAAHPAARKEETPKISDDRDGQGGGTD